MILTKLNPLVVNKGAYFIFFYTLIVLSHNSKVDTSQFFTDLAIFFISFSGIGILGYLLNDLSDIKTDIAVGKPNLMASLSFQSQITVILVLLLIGVLPIAIKQPTTLFFVVIEILLFFLYSFHPIRLKEKGLLGIVTDSLYAYVIPSFILLTYLKQEVEICMFFLVWLPIISFSIGVKNIANHQLKDVDNDTISKTTTYATVHLLKTKALEKNANLATIAIWIVGTIYILLNSFPTSIALSFTVVGIIFGIRTILYFIYKDLTFLRDTPEPIITCFGILTLLMCIVFQHQYAFLYLFIFLAVSSKFYHVFFIRGYYFIRQILSLIVNYSLYYSYLLVGINLKENVKNKQKESELILPKNTCHQTELQEKNVHGLWIGTQLSAMELLTIHSFIRHGYNFNLWTYEPLNNSLPSGCTIYDANEIIPFEHIFKYKYSSQFGTGKGSYAGFSDIFRYKLLHQVGGWWVDMDVTCLKPFDIDCPYFFREHHHLPMVGNIMKAPKGSALMLHCYNQASKEIDENNRDWHKPIEILVKAIQQFNLEKYIYSGASNSDEWHKIQPYVNTNAVINEKWHFIHWCNEVWRSNGYDKNTPLYASSYGQLLGKYGLMEKKSKLEQKKRDQQLKIKLALNKLCDFI